MLNIYLSSVLIWNVILVGLVCLFGQKIQDNGWTEGVAPATPGRAVLIYFFMSAIPIIRVLMAVTIIFMAMYTKEQFEALDHDLDTITKDLKDEDD